jgi:hypothetical protein
MIRLVERGVGSKKAFLELSATFTRPLVRNRYFDEAAEFAAISRRGFIFVAKGRIQISGRGVVVEASKGDVVEQELDGAVDFRIVEVPCTLVNLWQLELLIGDSDA